MHPTLHFVTWDYVLMNFSIFSGGRPKTALLPFTTMGRSIRRGCLDMFLNSMSSSSKWGCKSNSLKMDSLLRMNPLARTPILSARVLIHLGKVVHSYNLLFHSLDLNYLESSRILGFFLSGGYDKLKSCSLLSPL